MIATKKDPKSMNLKRNPYIPKQHKLQTIDVRMFISVQIGLNFLRAPPFGVSRIGPIVRTPVTVLNLVSQGAM